MIFLQSQSPTQKEVPRLRTKKGLADGWVLMILWALSAAVMVVWVTIDQKPPAWDQGDHLSRAMGHWQVLQHPQLLSGDWWRELWIQAPTQRAPLTYLVTALVFSLFGPGFDQGIYANLVFTAILLGSTYGIGRRIFSAEVGLWAAGFSLLSPTLLHLQKDYLLDYPMTAMVGLMFMAMTYFWLAENRSSRWLMTPLWGVGLGLMLMTRTSGLLFAVPPVAWMLGASLFRRQWLRLLQVFSGLAIALLTLWPWFSTNWLTVVTTTLASTSHGVSYRDDPQINSLAGWLYYIVRQPQLLSWALFGLAAIAWILILYSVFNNRQQSKAATPEFIQLLPRPWASRKSWAWLSAFLIGTYILFTLGSYKALRVYVPYISVFWVVLAQGIVAIRNRWWRFTRWVAVSLAVFFGFNQLFWAPAYAFYHPKTALWPNEAVISEITKTTPFLRANLGIAVNTPELNPFNLDFYGAVADFQVFARQLSLSADTVEQDAQALDWYLTKTGYQGAYDSIEVPQQLLRETLETSSELSLSKTWSLPDESELRLYHRKSPPITVEPLAEDRSTETVAAVTLDKVETAAKVAPGEPYPITYHIRGSGEDLASGLLLLSWQSTADPDVSAWISDHAIGLGYLNTAGAANTAFSVTENLSLVLPETVTEGLYRLRAEYLNRKTGEHYLISNDVATVEVVSAAPKPDKQNSQDLLSYLLYELSPLLSKGEIDPLFAQVGRINQYDPLQDYLQQAEQAMTYRLSQQAENTDWLYALAAAQVLQQKAPAATTTLTTLTERLPENAYNWAYLGLVHLYRWQPQQARAALDEAERLQPDLPNLKTLQAVNAAMQLNIPGAIRLARQ